MLQASPDPGVNEFETPGWLGPLELVAVTAQV